MAVEIRVPTLGESIVDAVIVKWLKKPGEPVARSEPVVELETDKVNVEVPADQAGTIASIAKQEGETVAVGELLGTIDSAAVGAAAPAPVAAVTAATSTISPPPQLQAAIIPPSTQAAQPDVVAASA